MPENTKARKTIKLRPIGSNKTAQAAPASPTVKLGAKTPAFTPTSGAPASPTVKLTPGAPSSGMDLEAPTVKLSVGAPLPASPTVKLSPGAPLPASPTVKLSPGAAPAPPLSSGEDDRTQPLKRSPSAETRPGSLIPGINESFGAKSPTTPSAPTAISKAVPPLGQEEDTVSMTRSELDEDATQTVGRPSQQSEASPMSTSSSLPGAKQTIKLRPSTISGPSAIPATPSPGATIKLKPAGANQADEDEHTKAMAKQTIKLVPNKGQAATATAKPAAPTVRLTPGASLAPKPSDPTIKLTEPQAPQPSDPTVKLTPQTQMPKPSAPTVKLTAVSGGPPPTPAATAEGAPALKPTLSIKRQPAATDTISNIEEGQLAPDALVSGEIQAQAKDEPSIIFTLVAVITLIVLGFVMFMLAGQYSNHWMGQNITIPGVSGKIH